MIPNKVELLCSRAQQAIAARDWEKAKQFYLLALEFRADTAEVHYGLATVYYQGFFPPGSFDLSLLRRAGFADALGHRCSEKVYFLVADASRRRARRLFCLAAAQ